MIVKKPFGEVRRTRRAGPDRKAYEDFDKLAVSIEKLMKLKRKMIEKKLMTAWTNCPICGDRLNAALAKSGRGFHLRAKCTSCSLSMME